MAKLVFIRHGQSEWNALNLFNGWVDTKLSEEGIRQAKEAGELLAEKGIEFDQAYTSVLTRAIQTLHITLEEIGQLWIPEEKSWRLNERHYGALQGLNKKASAEKWGDDQVHIWRRSYDVLPPLQDSIQKSITVDGRTYPALDRRYAELDPKTLPLGENLKVTLTRVMPFWEDKIAPDLRAGKNVIIAAHGNSLRALSKYIENISDADIMGLEIANGQPIVYDFDKDLKVTNKELLAK
ncbi:2,3-diphosphoglycerate-dependent phosphoglycerate mutase [Oenococcus kitaharae]|uniref:2,3-bisphosphoglycerate-dependent phosphoglycerate mutase n=1 Tax=Oenococcus kitaharae DSM 17330 TaxID=1045004 RepID=G9WJ45_9LACO|nr:2,3-diphosphoglycerate-dependent phosphoglycerate mutase [Oenococcus kitaharae]EHN58494.1 Phosphoglycerate mutase [Oenococcus kitaharae DSM 17330]MCV3296267.1 2,3-diphosphoglycerate-dependent phosphoglycerate mutase [Oenococcus kitaharae]OEY81354.1 phosphoglyceromutase [Oenococcus kitaharae]OEY82842.1 phosphoglyceromutase [Oenococcus kitaharae]OEY84614.1 phosphoglyceromutase [Oenococcus kitaharae]